MPEGPSIAILKDEAEVFSGKTILQVGGKNKNIDIAALIGKKVVSFKTWGKHFLICLPESTIKIHLMLFGSYLINSQKSLIPQLSLQFENGEINFYACFVTEIKQPLNQVYDWSADIMNREWSDMKAMKKLTKHPKMMVCDALLDQKIFSGSGNIIKNEVLFQSHIHPESLLGKIPPAKLEKMVKGTVKYSFQFYKWEKANVFRENWQVYKKETCPRDGTTIKKIKSGKSGRTNFYCPSCQKLYN